MLRLSNFDACESWYRQIIDFFPIAKTVKLAVIGKFWQRDRSLNLFKNHTKCSYLNFQIHDLVNTCLI